MSRRKPTLAELRVLRQRYKKLYDFFVELQILTDDICDFLWCHPVNFGQKNFLETVNWRAFRFQDVARGKMTEVEYKIIMKKQINPKKDHVAILNKFADTAQKLQKSGRPDEMFVLDAIQELSEQIAGIHDELTALREDIAYIKEAEGLID